MKVLCGLAKKLPLIMTVVTWAGLYILAATLLSILLGVPMWCISAAVVLAAVVWEVLEGAKKNGKR